MIGQTTFSDMHGKFIIGQSGIPDDAGLSKILIFDVFDSHPLSSLPIYDADRNKELIYATKDGALRATPNGPYQAYNNSVIEPDGFTVDTLDKAVERMLLEQLKSIKVVKSEMLARKTLLDLPYDVGCDRILTHNDLSGLPEGLSLAIAPPEYIGFIYIRGVTNQLATEWGACILNVEHSMILFESNTVLPAPMIRMQAE